MQSVVPQKVVLTCFTICVHLVHSITIVDLVWQRVAKRADDPYDISTCVKFFLTHVLSRSDREYKVIEGSKGKLSTCKEHLVRKW